MFFDTKKLARFEEKTLAPYAVLSKNSKGRQFKEKLDETRLCFQKDRDRIIHCRAFRRLKAKTQVFVSHYGDHYRNRLTHTLEVAQISRDMARNLGLNEDLAEAIALAHDLGHTPFGHAGEEALNEIMQQFGLHFEHNEQSRRIVEKLENVYPNFKGLNLTFEVREGLIKHQSSWDQLRKKTKFRTLEAEVVNLADEIAYQNHDIDDGLSAGILNWDDLRKLNLWQRSLQEVEKKYGKLERRLERSRGISNLISLMITDVFSETQKRISKYKIKTFNDLLKIKEPIICFSKEVSKENQELKHFLTENLYLHPKVKTISDRERLILKAVFERLYKNISFLPKNMQKLIAEGERKEIVVKDYVAGMTDEWLEKVKIQKWAHRPPPTTQILTKSY